MHSCLQIPELVAEVCSHLYDEKYRASNGDLVVLSRTSTIFSTHTLALIWKSVDLMTLLLRFPRDCFAVNVSDNAQGFDRKFTMRPRRRLGDSDFERVLFYSQFIQHLSPDAHFRDPIPMLPTSASRRLSASLAPVLRGLAWIHEGEYDIKLIKHFLTPHLTRLSLPSASLAMLKWLSALGTLCPQLNNLHFSHPRGASYDLQLEADSAVSECLRGLQHIQKFAGDTLDELALQHLSGLPTVRELRLSDVSLSTAPVRAEDEDEETLFPSLQKLYFTTLLIDSPTLFTAFCHKTPLAELNVECSEGFCSAEDVEHLFFGAVTGLSPSTLKEFTFLNEPESLTDAPMRPPVDTANYLITSQSMSDLCRFHNLVSVYIFSGVGVDLSRRRHRLRDGPVLAAHRAFGIVFSPRYLLPARNAPLPQIAQPILHEAEQALYSFVPLESLRDLDVEASPIGEVHVQAVARFLAHIFPRLITLETLGTSLEGETEWVEELVPGVVEANDSEATAYILWNGQMGLGLGGFWNKGIGHLMASLPPELEKSIFELTAYSEPKVKKYLYRVLMLRGRETYSHNGWEDYPYDDDALFTRLKSIPPSVLRDSVRHLYLEVMPVDLCQHVLSTCTAVEDLLHCHPVYLFSTQEQLDFGHPLFSNLTHFELFFGSPDDEEFDPSSWKGLACIPHLTHLSFSDPVFLSLVPTMLQDCKLLCTLVFILDRDWMEADEASAVLSSIAPRHLRFAQMECAAFGKDWRSGALGRGDYWDRAEAFVAKRITREIDPALYVLEGEFASNSIPYAIPNTFHVVVVTGGNTGIGYHTVKQLLLKYAKVYIAGRSAERVAAAIKSLEAETNGKKAIFLELDLGDLRRMDESGVFSGPPETLTAQGLDLEFGTNVLGHFFFTQLLLPALTKSSQYNKVPARVINTSSFFHPFAPGPGVDFITVKGGPERDAWIKKAGVNVGAPMGLYGQSKFGNILVSNYWAKTYSDALVSCAVHPGWIKSDITRMGALTQLWAGTVATPAQIAGEYVVPWGKIGKPDKRTTNAKVEVDVISFLKEQIEGF
ncbi:hypothetical protein FB45DRAFT_1036817 [Roridomyces roridus]|uniref:Uncharacterized protein n=1 Tax=Roridomyces roridus TaxID=1738132 RepID=A0AAD7B7N6_9AGAR|nr:hypothetical protein FB45DRAFT_1036817 [Roridomyces roridus]